MCLFWCVGPECLNFFNSGRLKMGGSGGSTIWLEEGLKADLHSAPWRKKQRRPVLIQSVENRLLIWSSLFVLRSSNFDYVTLALKKASREWNLWGTSWRKTLKQSRAELGETAGSCPCQIQIWIKVGHPHWFHGCSLAHFKLIFQQVKTRIVLPWNGQLRWRFGIRCLGSKRTNKWSLSHPWKTSQAAVVSWNNHLTQLGLRLWMTGRPTVWHDVITRRP